MYDRLTENRISMNRQKLNYYQILQKTGFDRTLILVFLWQLKYGSFPDIEGWPYLLPNANFKIVDYAFILTH